MMISVHDFNVSTFESKCDLIIYCSDYLLSRETGTIKSHLYHYGGFFIEVHYSTLLKKVLGINAFNKFEELDPYTVGISLSDLIVYG